MITCMYATIVQSLNLMRKRLVRDTTFTSVFQTQLCNFDIIWSTMQTCLPVPSNLKTGQWLIWNITPVYTAAQTCTEQNKVLVWYMLKLVQWFGQVAVRSCALTHQQQPWSCWGQNCELSPVWLDPAADLEVFPCKKKQKNILFSHCIQWP